MPKALRLSNLMARPGVFALWSAYVCYSQFKDVRPIVGLAVVGAKTLLWRKTSALPAC